MGEISLTSSQLTERYSLPVKVKETLTVQEIIHTQAGEIVLDMGQNMVGTLAAGQTMAFITLSISQLVQSYNMRSERSLFHIGPFSNKKLNQACLASLALVLLVLFTPLRIAFGLLLCLPRCTLIAFGLSFVPLLVIGIFQKVRSDLNTNTN